MIEFATRVYNTHIFEAEQFFRHLQVTITVQCILQTFLAMPMGNKLITY